MQRWPVAALVAILFVTGCSKPAPAPAPVPAPAPEPAISTPAPYQPGEKHRQALALLENNTREAKDLLQALVAAEPENADAWNDLSFAQARLMQYADAVTSARKALALRPQFVYAEYNLGWALLNTNEWPAAKSHLEVNSKALPDRPEPLYALGLWFEMSGNTVEAVSYYQRAAQMEYAPAMQALAKQADQKRRQTAADEAISRFPKVPPGVIRSVLTGYIPSGVTRKLIQVMPVQFDPEQPPLWAALIFDTYEKSVSTEVEVYTATASGSSLDGYRGSCHITSTPGEVQVHLQALPAAGEENLMVQVPGETIICGLEDEKYVKPVYRTKGVATLTGEGLVVDGQPLRFVSEIAEYLPASEAEQVLALIGEVRATGAKLQMREAVTAQVKLAGGPGVALAWPEATNQDHWGYRLMIAVKPEGGPAILYTAGHEVRNATPYRIGSMAVPGHTFLAVATYQKDGPNGGDVLVLAYEQEGGLRKVFNGSSDSAGFGETSVHTTFKGYRLEGGFDLYTTTFDWDETRGTFVEGKTEKSPFGK